MMRGSVISTVLLAACVLVPREVPAQPSPADALVRQGRAAMDSNALGEALFHLRRATVSDPASSAAHRYHGEVAEMLGEFGEALDAYRAAARLSPTDDAVLRVASLAQRTGLGTEAIAELRRHLPHASRDGVAELLFRVYVEAGDRAAALALAKARNWVQPGANYCGLPVAGIAIETRALLAMLLHPLDAACAIRLARSLADNGQPRLARVILSEVAQKDSNNRARLVDYIKIGLPAHDVPPMAEALNVTAYRLATRHRSPNEAIELYKRAIAIDPKFSWPLSSLGMALAQRGQIDDALEALRRAVAVNPNDWRAYRNLGEVATQARRWDEALNAYSLAIALNPTSVSEAAQAGRLLVYLGKREDGMKVMQRAVTAMPSLAEARAFLRAAPDRLRLVDEMLDASGVQRSVPHAVSGLRAGLEALLSSVVGPTEKPVVRERVEAAITATRVSHLFTAWALSEFDAERVRRVLAWWRSPVGTRIRQMEHDSLGVSRETLKQYEATLADPMAVLAAMRRLDTAQQGTESDLDLVYGMKRGVFAVLNPHLSVDRRRTRDDFERERHAAYDATDAATALRFAYIYRTATPEEAAEHLRFLTSDAGRWFTTLLRQASVGVVETVSEQAAHATLRQLKQPAPDRGKETR